MVIAMRRLRVNFWKLNSINLSLELSFESFRWERDAAVDNAVEFLVDVVSFVVLLLPLSENGRDDFFNLDDAAAVDVVVAVATPKPPPPLPPYFNWNKSCVDDADDDSDDETDDLFRNLLRNEYRDDVSLVPMHSCNIFASWKSSFSCNILSRLLRANFFESQLFNGLRAFCCTIFVAPLCDWPLLMVVAVTVAVAVLLVRVAVLFLAFAPLPTLWICGDAMVCSSVISVESSLDFCRSTNGFVDSESFFRSLLPVSNLPAFNNGLIAWNMTNAERRRTDVNFLRNFLFFENGKIKAMKWM